MDIANKKIKPPTAATASQARVLTGFWLVFSAIAFVIYFLMKARVVVLYGQYYPLGLQLCVATGTAALILAVAAFAVKLIRRRAQQRSEGYN